MFVKRLFAYIQVKLSQAIRQLFDKRFMRLCECERLKIILLMFVKRLFGDICQTVSQLFVDVLNC